MSTPRVRPIAALLSLSLLLSAIAPALAADPSLSAEPSSEAAFDAQGHPCRDAP